MIQRRTPSGQGPARRPVRGGRAGAIRAGRPGMRDPSGRVDARQGIGRSAALSRAAGSGRPAEGPRSTSRPAAARRTVASGTVRRTYAPKPRSFPGRATVLIGVLVALALAYTYPVRVYLNQQSDIARMEAEQRAQRERIGELTEEAALWKDPEYIKIQARERFYMVLPGEVPLVVLRDPAGAARDAGIDPEATEQGGPKPWYDTLWSSVQAANEERPADR